MAEVITGLKSSRVIKRESSRLSHPQAHFIHSSAFSHVPWKGQEKEGERERRRERESHCLFCGYVPKFIANPSNQ